MTKEEEKKEDATVSAEEPKIEEIVEYLNKMTELEAAVVQAKEQSLRYMAEADNTRKRAEKEVEEARKFALSSFIKELIDVVENLYRSTEHITEEQKQNEAINKVFTGIVMTQDEFMKVLGKYGVVRILPSVGDKFDYNFHQTISQLKDDNYPPNTIINIIQAGYTLHGRLIRPAMVVVSSTS